MVSMACYQDHHLHHMAIDPLPVAYSSTSLSPPDVSSIRCIFQGVARVNKQAASASASAATRSSRNTTMEQATMALPEEPDSMENSESSISSCFLSSNSDDDDFSSSSTSSTLSPDAAASPQHEGPLVNLSSLCAALPVKRGLSRYFSGKSQSFSSLAHVSSVADLAKPENPYVKRRRTTAGDSLLKHQSYPPRCASTRAANSKRHANNHYKGLRSFPVCDDADLEGQAKPYPIKCFSLPELQETE